MPAEKSSRPAPADPKGSPAISHLKGAGLLAGPLAAGVMLLLSPPAGLTAEAWQVAAVVTLMAFWWLTEAIPLPATALLPAILFPLLEINTLPEAVAPYANPVIFLFLGGFIVALTVERWGLHRRLAIGVVSLMAARADRLIAGFMLATAGLSMWVSNTATAMMMLPVALSVIALLEAQAASPKGGEPMCFPRALLLAIAYSASIGGMATLIGTPPNAFFAGFMQQTYGVEIGFLRWMLFALPLSAIMLLASWLLLTRMIYPIHRLEFAGFGAGLAAAREGLGPVSRGEGLSGLLLLAVALAWVFRPLLDNWVPLSDSGIALIGALAAFLIPVNLRRMEFLMNWEHAKQLPWGILLLFGGGLSLAQGIDQSGLADWIGGALSRAETLPLLGFVAVLTLAVIFLTELTSNTATAAVLVPIAAAVSLHLGYDPVALAIPAVLAASCAFMMPVATPPNAVVFSSGRITILQMCAAGFLVNLLAFALIALWSLLAEDWVF